MRATVPQVRLTTPAADAAAASAASPPGGTRRRLSCQSAGARTPAARSNRGLGRWPSRMQTAGGTALGGESADGGCVGWEACSGGLHILGHILCGPLRGPAPICLSRPPPTPPPPHPPTPPPPSMRQPARLQPAGCDLPGARQVWVMGVVAISWAVAATVWARAAEAGGEVAAGVWEVVGICGEVAEGVWEVAGMGGEVAVRAKAGAMGGMEAAEWGCMAGVLKASGKAGGRQAAYVGRRAVECLQTGHAGSGQSGQSGRSGGRGVRLPSTAAAQTCCWPPEREPRQATSTHNVRRNFWMSLRTSSATYTTSKPEKDTTAMPAAERAAGSGPLHAAGEARFHRGTAGTSCVRHAAQILQCSGTAAGSQLSCVEAPPYLLGLMNCPGPTPWVPKASWYAPVGPYRSTPFSSASVTCGAQRTQHAQRGRRRLAMGDVGGAAAAARRACVRKGRRQGCTFGRADSRLRPSPHPPPGPALTITLPSPVTAINTGSMSWPAGGPAFPNCRAAALFGWPFLGIPPGQGGPSGLLVMPQPGASLPTCCPWRGTCPQQPRAPPTRTAQGHGVSALPRNPFWTCLAQGGAICRVQHPYPLVAGVCLQWQVQAGFRL